VTEFFLFFRSTGCTGDEIFEAAAVLPVTHHDHISLGKFNRLYQSRLGVWVMRAPGWQKSTIEAGMSLRISDLRFCPRRHRQ